MGRTCVRFSFTSCEVIIKTFYDTKQWVDKNCTKHFPLCFLFIIYYTHNGIFYISGIAFYSNNSNIPNIKKKPQQMKRKIVQNGTVMILQSQNGIHREGYSESVDFARDYSQNSSFAACEWTNDFFHVRTARFAASLLVYWIVRL